MTDFNHSALHSRGERLRSFKQPKMPKYGVPSWRNDPSRSVPSKQPTADVTSKTDNQQYTGTFVKGIATMHKSNTVPVTDNSQAVDIAKMRRN